MLRSLELENFLLFENASFSFSPGLNAVSGETGAGKSLLARALGLALGGRGGHDVVRSGCDQAVVRAEFTMAKPDDSSSAPSSGTVLIERTVRREGGGITVNGKAATAQWVRQNLAPLVDFAAQNEHMRLADSQYQLELLDAYGKLAGDVERYQKAFHRAEELAKRLRSGREERELLRLRLELVRKDISLLDKAAYDPAVDGRIEAEIKEMSNAAGIVQAAAHTVELLEEGDPPVVETLTAAWKTLDRFSDVSPRISEAARDLEEALDLAGNALAVLSGLAEDMDADPKRLDALITRAEMLKTLAKRLDCSVEGLPAARERLLREEEKLADSDLGEDETRARLAEFLPEVASTGDKLGKKRREAAGKLQRAVNRELAGLGMEQAGFEVVFEPLWQNGMPIDAILSANSSGLDEVGFFISPNPGEAPSAVAGDISGGEASRSVLALKAALSEVYRPNLMFLDEVDAGVGARLGRELGVKLKEMSNSRQVVVITHLPQIAAYADRHFKVAKQVKEGRTVAWVKTLSPEERVGEVASMIHGSSAGEVTLTQAKEMLREGGNWGN